MNLETWRQLWRVTEISDIILFIVDIRFPILHFSPVFYKHVKHELSKDIILILNKIDLVDTSVVVAWKKYFEARFPGIHVIMFSSSRQINFRNKKRQRGMHSKVTAGAAGSGGAEPTLEELETKALAANIYTARAHRQLYEVVNGIVNGRVDLKSWSDLTEDMLRKSTTTTLESTNSELLEQLTLTNQETDEMHELIHTRVERQKFANNFITIGCCGSCFKFCV
jgi:tRNA U34 5-carboxymethylaminomethyl modifying GTPase MnmE/TrmE